ncbi:MAG: 3-phosphoshikimate 1-carboxyvinyltransferase 2 [Melioribacteraceae bacterium]|nr:MAG: 3-phosphoshikimate 1-carboxyvinyltransferase 2 [Melioribacteraceae bacterium]
MYLIKPEYKSEITVNLPSSKSLTHRSLILGSLNRGSTTIREKLVSEDTTITLEALKNLGAHWVEKDGVIRNNTILGANPGSEIFLGNSGSSARFLLPLAAFCKKPVKYYGVDRLHERPFNELLDSMMMLGIDLSRTNDGLPVVVYPSKVAGGSISFGSLPSSQVVTSLMISGLWMEKPLTIELPHNTPSLPYITMTYKLMKQLGLEVQFEQDTIFVANEPPENDWNLKIEKDYSAASYWVIYGLINDAKVILPGLTLPSLQGDHKILEIAELAGGNVMLYDDRTEITGRISKGINLDCGAVPDLVPALAVLAMFAPEKSALSNIRHLEYKESNRVAAIQQNISALGGSTEYQNGSLVIHPAKNYKSAEIKTFDDHRIAMSFAVAGCKIPEITIDKPECVQKSYPEFWNDFTHWEKRQ